MLFASCSRSLTDLGYSTRYIIYDKWDRRTQPITNPEEYLLLSRTGTYKTNQIICDEGVRNFLAAQIYFRQNILKDFYAQMNADDFSSDAFAKEYSSLCAPDILAAATTYAKANPDNALGGWQVFKPMPGLDTKKAKYDIAYEGDDWFSITPDGDDVGVRLRIVLTADKLRPVIVAVENLAFDVSAAIEAGSNVGKGYKNVDNYSLGVVRLPLRNQSYFDWLAKKLSHISGVAERGVVTEADITDFYNDMVEDRAMQLTAFISALGATDFNNRQLSHKYGNWLNIDVNRAITANAGKSGKWNAFNTDGEKTNIAYEGNNWFRLSSDADSTKEIMVQMVLCGNKQLPIITGLNSPADGIALGTDFSLTRASR